MIDFNQIPVNLRTPGQYVEIDNSMALNGLTGINQKLLILGQRLSTGETVAQELVLVSSKNDAERRFGRGSMLAAMCGAAKAVNSYTEMWAVALDDDDAAVASTGSITLGGAVTASGTLFVYIAGQRVKVLAPAAATPEQVATALVEAINADSSLPVTSAVDGTVAEKVNITARNKGVAGNTIDLRTNYYQGESLPKGLTITIEAMDGGTSNPDIADAIAALAEERFDYIAMPWTDTANMNALDTELEDRWGPMRQIEGLAFAAASGTQAELQTLGNSRNNKLVTLMGAGLSPVQPCIWAAVYAAVAAFNLNNDPARPLQTLKLGGMMPPGYDKRFTRAERNMLLYDGVSTYMVDVDGTCRIERAITTYQTNAYGVDDPSYLDINTLATLAYIRAQVRTRISNRFGRHKLAKDGTPVRAGQAIATPGSIHAELVALFKDMESAGIVEDLEQFKTDLVVEIDNSDPNRVNALLPPNIINQLRVFAGQVQFRL